MKFRLYRVTAFVFLPPRMSLLSADGLAGSAHVGLWLPKVIWISCLGRTD